MGIILITLIEVGRPTHGGWDHSLGLGTIKQAEQKVLHAFLSTVQ